LQREILKTYMKMKRVILLMSAVIALMSCSESETPDVGEPLQINLSGAELRISREGNIFGMELLSATLNRDIESENVIVSPLSLNFALAMLWNGANGETRDAIQKTMGMSDYPVSEVNACFKKLKEALPATDPTTILALANSIWAHKDFSVKESFYEVNRKWYDAQVGVLDFSDSSAPAVINQWCADNTNGLITDMIDKIPDDAVMYLLNALYFKGSWSAGYAFPVEATAEAEFRKDGGETLTVKMMHQTSQQLYYSDEVLAWTTLPYGNGAFRMMFVLPNEDVSFAEVFDKLRDPDYLLTTESLAAEREISLFVPKFKLEYETSLNGTLTDMGMGIAFDRYKADLLNLGYPPPGENLYVSNVKQKTFIDVNEEGSEAAAVTSIEISLTTAGPSQPTVFYANRPFLFLIQEVSSGVILFAGKIGSPE
jgi:serpin B